MKALSFSAVEILPALLDKTKVQTMRPAWRDDIKHQFRSYDDNEIVGKKVSKAITEKIIPQVTEKPARYKVGEKVRLYWCQRSKNKYYCIEHQKALLINPWATVLFCPEKQCNTRVTLLSLAACKGTLRDLALKRQGIFTKILGEVEITEVFQIIMKSNEKTFEITLSPGFDYRACAIASGLVHEESIVRNYAMEMIGNDFNKVAKMDGFKSPKEMFKWFDKNYDLSSRKKFWVYRWKWLK